MDARNRIQFTAKARSTQEMRHASELDVAGPLRPLRLCGERTTPSLVLVLLSILFINAAPAQTLYPGEVIQDVDWDEGTHHISRQHGIVAPGDEAEPFRASADAQVELVSNTSIRLTPGFHASAFNEPAQFHAYIANGLEEILVVPSEPPTPVVDNILHVNKWEKLELAIQLPQAYQQAIDGFFERYYSNGTDVVATPNAVDPVHDLNPYADDSLQLVMTLTKPSGEQTMKWGFFMREVRWNGTEEWATQELDEQDNLSSYNAHFRIAPDEEGLWSFSISIKAPHTLTTGGQQLPDLDYGIRTFFCDPPQEDNHGPLHVNTANRRTLQFADGTSFFGLGTNMPDGRGGPDDAPPSPNYGRYFKQGHDQMLQTMEQLHDVGGNFLRMYLMRFMFAPEWVNLGVYDSYFSNFPCASLTSVGSWRNTSNCQYHCRAFDAMLEQARAQDIYIQLCIDPYPPVINFERIIWGRHPYVEAFLEPDRDLATGRYDLKEFFYTPDPITGEPTLDKGVFYYWKRRYKYIMSRWGYSVNIAALEPFNEIDQLLTYEHHDMTNAGTAVCPENRLVWPKDPAIPAVIDQWVTDISEYVRGEVELGDPVASPLGETEKLFLMSYAWNDPDRTDRETFYKPFYNPNVDLIDAHSGMGGGHHELSLGSSGSDAYHNVFQSPDENGILQKKPFHHGEFNYYAALELDGNPNNGTGGLNGLFHNYDVCFHNELWASTFYGNFAAGTSWSWERVYWWKNALPDYPGSLPFDGDNEFQTVHRGYLGFENILDLGQSVQLRVQNRRLHHHFKPLSDLINDATLPTYGFFNGDFTSHRVFDSENNIPECYYLMNTTKDLAIGWVHNINAFWPNNYYYRKGNENVRGCIAPGTQTVDLPGFLPDEDYYISYYPTRSNSAIKPDDDFQLAGSDIVTLDLSTAPLGGVLNNFLDTLHADYAFIISTSHTKSRPVSAPLTVTEDSLDWYFTIYPNPASDHLMLKVQDDAQLSISIWDVAGKQVYLSDGMKGPLVTLSLGHLARGAYNLQVSHTTGFHSKTFIKL